MNDWPLLLAAPTESWDVPIDCSPIQRPLAVPTTHGGLGDPKFVYVHATATDVAATFKRVKKFLKERASA